MKFTIRPIQLFFHDETEYIYANVCILRCITTQLWIVMPFINGTKRLGTELVSPSHIGWHVSPVCAFSCCSLSFCRRRIASKKNRICAEMEEGAICCLLVFEANRFVRYVISSRVVIRAWRIMFPWPAKRTV